MMKCSVSLIIMTWLYIGLCAYNAKAETVRVVADRDTFIVAVNPFEVAKKIREVNASRHTTKKIYEEHIRRPKAGEQYADSSDLGVPDVPPVVVNENKEVEVEKGIFQAVGDSIAKNPWAWAGGAAAAAGGLYLVGDNNGWFSSKGGEDRASDTPTIAITQNGNGSVNVVVNNNGGNTSTSTGPNPVVVPTK